MAPLDLQRGKLLGERLVFETPGGIARALADGCFRVAIPSDLDLSPGLTLCREFYREPGGERDRLSPYRGFRARQGIYFDREHFQTEHLLLDGPMRARYFPPELVAMCDAMSALGLSVLRAVLEHLQIPRALWLQITGGAVDGRGTHWFAASHYRPEREMLGCAPHKDTGFVTVLYIDETGLEALRAGAWTPIEPEPGYFLVNFGGAFELLTARLPQPVQAILHRVRRCDRAPGKADRISFAAFANPPSTGMLYQLQADASAEAVGDVEEFLREFNARTWDDRHVDFGISSSSAAQN